MKLTATQRLEIKLKIISIAFNVIVFVGIALCSIFYNKYIECAILFLTFICLRYTFPKTYHSASLWVCLFWSIMIFFIALPNVLPIQLSILFGIVIGRSMEGFGEKELEVATLMIYTDYKNSIGQNLDLAVRLAFDWLNDKDTAVKGAEKLAIYHDCIVEGDDD